MKIGEYADNSSKRRLQNRRAMQYIAKGTAEGVVRENSPSCRHPVSSLSSSEHFFSKISRKKYFSPYLSEEAAEAAVVRGNAFKATFRVNAYNRLEAYCTIKGVPIDVLINGVEAQNRAIEGDVVAVALDPVTKWTRFKGASANGSLNSIPANEPCSNSGRPDGSDVLLQNSSDANSSTEPEEVKQSLARICSMVTCNPLKRPTGRVLAILKSSPKRASVTGFFSLKQSHEDVEGLVSLVKGHFFKKNEEEWIQLMHTDHRFPKMMVSVRTLPESIKERVKAGDVTVERELVAAEIYDWNEETQYPHARVIDVFGRGGEIEPRIAAILFENSICAAKYSPNSLACLPDMPWKIPDDEFKSRKDLRKVCSFTIDPSSAIDLDDALSVEILSGEVLRIGVHIADVSYFVLPDTTLDAEAQARSTSVYVLQHKLPMLPPYLSEELCSLLPGEDRLTFSIIWDIDLSGKIINRWIGRSIINSCCKLSYDFVQAVIDKSFDFDEHIPSSSTGTKLYGDFTFKDVIESLRILYEISSRLRKTRFNGGALHLETIKTGFLFDEYGIPYDSMICKRMESCFLVEEFMLLTNMSVAEVISQAFPDSSLLRRHPEPNLRKLKEFETFWGKHGLEFDTSSSGQLHLSLVKIKEEIKNDPVLFDIVVSYASKLMQPAVYFSTGDLKESKNEWAHYSLNVPLYTHFTSPIRRYPDIIVHRILSAVLHAEKMYLKQCVDRLELSETEIVNTYFTGLRFNKNSAESIYGREALYSSALKFKIPDGNALVEIAAHCNEKSLASRRTEEASEKLYLWALMKKKETPLVTEARVLALGPRFMSIYIPYFGMERRIYYDEVDCLCAEWLEMTGKLVLDLIRGKIGKRRNNLGNFRPLEDVVLLTYPSASDLDEENTETISFGPCSANVITEKS
ncbi:DIS3-like exonuclease 2 isoform X2 [Phalaenopsis equestris]|nr:DIS3-like exonuclease 2 isoform X2 [Phalaenopsis equestris]